MRPTSSKVWGSAARPVELQQRMVSARLLYTCLRWFFHQWCSQLQVLNGSGNGEKPWWKPIPPAGACYTATAKCTAESNYLWTGSDRASTTHTQYAPGYVDDSKQYPGGQYEPNYTEQHKQHHKCSTHAEPKVTPWVSCDQRTAQWPAMFYHLRRKPAYLAIGKPAFSNFVVIIHKNSGVK